MVAMFIGPLGGWAAREGRLADEGQPLALSTTPIAGSLSRVGSTAWPLRSEGILRLVAIGALLRRFALLAAQETGRQRRFAEATVTVRSLPDPALPKLCANLGSS